MKYLSLFSGYGGFELGINKAYEDYFSNKKQMPEQEGLSYPRDSLYPTSKRDRKDRDKHPTCIGYSEIDKYAIQIYEKHFKHKNYGDITKINEKELPDFDLFVGGFPCQAFSIAGKRGGFEDTRGTLIFDVLRILKTKQPRLVLLENVKGLLSHDGGRTFKTIISALAELGYAVEWQVLNAKNFGVPQNRERVFIIGHLGGFGGRQVFPIGETNTTTIEQINNPKHSNDRVYKKNGISPTLNTMQGGNRQPFIANTLDSNYYKGNSASSDRHTPRTVIPVLTPDRIEKRQNGRRFKEDGEPSFTLTGQDKHGIYDGMKIRRLTPTECERLMGLPDGWTDGVSDTQRYKLCGNGVVVNVVREIIKRLI